MNWRNADIKLLIVAAVISVSLPFLFSDLGYAPSGIDPATEFYTKDHSDSYGSIDQWAYHGMKQETVVKRLAMDGYVCMSPQPSGAGVALSGIRELACDKALSGLLARTLSIKASIDYDSGGGLVAAHASSKLEGDYREVRGRIADVLRKFDWIEPEELQVRGFEVDSIDMLTRLAVDALSARGWHKTCEEDLSPNGCLGLALERRASGFQPVGEGIVAGGDLMDVHSAMESIHLVPIEPRPDVRSDDTLLVRVAEEKMWLDFAGRDLAGRELMVSIALDSEGGAPVKLLAKVGADTRETALAGKRRVANNGKVRYFVPLAAPQNPRLAVWRDLPNKYSPDSYKSIGDGLANIDPAFASRLVKVILAGISAATPPEEVAGLYPALRSIEYQADILRSAHAERWLPKETSIQAFVRQTYPADSAVRASWALAMCESATRPPTIDADCLRDFIKADPEVAVLLNKEVADLQSVYVSLDLTHPLWLRLTRLGAALQRAELESSGAVQNTPPVPTM